MVVLGEEARFLAMNRGETPTMAVLGIPMSWDPSTAGNFPEASRATTFPGAVPVFAVAAVPRPRFVRAWAAVEAPVPPLTMPTTPLTEVAEVAFPLRFAVIVPALKFPEASR